MQRVLQLLLCVLHLFLHISEHIAQCRLSLHYIRFHVCNDVHVCFGYFGDDSMDDAQAQAESEQKHVDRAADAIPYVCVWSEELYSMCVFRGAPAVRCDARPHKHTILLLHLCIHIGYICIFRHSVRLRAHSSYANQLWCTITYFNYLTFFFVFCFYFFILFILFLFAFTWIYSCKTLLYLVFIRWRKTKGLK